MVMLPNLNAKGKRKYERSTWLNFNTKEIALISVLSSAWIISEIYLGVIIGQVTHVHGITERLVGWFLMLVLAEISGKFGRVSTMAAIAALATRVIRRSALEGLIVGLGYFLGGLTFDLLFFIPVVNKFKGKTQNIWILTTSIISGVVALIPYLFLKLSVLGIYGFIAFTPQYAYSLVKGTILSVLGTLAGMPFLPQIKACSSRTRT